MKGWADLPPPALTGLSTTFQALGWVIYAVTYYRYRMSLRRVSGLEEGLGNLKGAKIEKSSK